MKSAAYQRAPHRRALPTQCGVGVQGVAPMLATQQSIAVAAARATPNEHAVRPGTPNPGVACAAPMRCPWARGVPQTLNQDGARQGAGRAPWGSSGTSGTALPAGGDLVDAWVGAHGCDPNPKPPCGTPNHLVEAVHECPVVGIALQVDDAARKVIQPARRRAARFRLRFGALNRVPNPQRV